jgi:hypothetical protein
MVALKEAKVLIKYARKIEAIGRRTFQQLWGEYSVLYKCFNDENRIWGVSDSPEAVRRTNNSNNKATIAIIDLELLIVRRKIAKALSGQYLNLNNATDATDADANADADSIIIDRNNCEQYRIAYKQYNEVRTVLQDTQKQIRIQRLQERENRRHQRRQQYRARMEGLLMFPPFPNNDDDNNRFNNNQNENEIISIDDLNGNGNANANGNNNNNLEVKLTRLRVEYTRAVIEKSRAEEVLTGVPTANNLRLGDILERLLLRHNNNNNNNNNNNGVGIFERALPAPLFNAARVAPFRFEAHLERAPIAALNHVAAAMNNENNINNNDNDGDDDGTNIIVDYDSDDAVNADSGDANDLQNNEAARAGAVTTNAAYNILKEEIVQEELAYIEEWNQQKDAIKLNLYYDWFRNNNGVLLIPGGR